MNDISKGKMMDYKNSIPLKLFLITINLLLAYILTNIAIFLNILKFFSGLTLIVIIASTIRKHSTNQYTTSIFNINWTRLVKKYIKINRMYIFSSIIGLIIAALIISQIMIVSDAYDKKAFTSYIENSPNSAFEFDFTGYNYNIIGNWKQTLEESITPIIADRNFEIDRIESTNTINFKIRISDPTLITESPGPIGSYFYQTADIGHSKYSRSLFSIFQQFPTFNKSISYKPGDNLLVIDPYKQVNINNIWDNGNISMLIGSEVRLPNQNFSEFHYPVTYVWKPDSSDVLFVEKEGILGGQSYLNSHLYIPEEEEWNIYTNILQEDIEENDVLIPPLLTSISDVYVKMPNFVNEDVDVYINNLEQTRLALRIWLDGQVNGINYVRSPLKTTIEEYYENSGQDLQLIGLIASGPLLGLSLFLVYFSLTLIEKRKSILIATMRVRGTSREQITTMLYSEVVVGGIIAVVVGISLSIPLLLISLQNSKLIPPIEGWQAIKYIPKSYFINLPIIGLILAFDLNTSSITTLSGVTVDEIGDVEEKKVPIWHKLYLDLLLVLISFSFWFVIYYVPIQDPVLKNNLVTIIGPIMSIIFLIGLPFTAIRYFAQVFGPVSNLLWNTRRGFFSLATRNMKNHKFSSSRLIAFLLLGIMLSTISLVLPNSIDTWGYEQSKYNIGADIEVSGINYNNITQMELIRNMSGIEAASKIARFSYITSSDQIDIMGIDPNTISDVLYWDSSYNEKPLTELTDKLEDNTILMQDKVFKSSGLKIGDEYVLKYRYSFRYTIVDTFNLFPTLVFDVPTADNKGIYQISSNPILMNLPTLYNFSISSNRMQTSALIKIKDHALIENITDSLEKIFYSVPGLEVKNINNVHEKLYANENTELILDSLNLILIVTLITSMVAILYHSFITLSERRVEIGIYRALGMIRKQISKLLLTESLTLIFSSLLVGMLAGIFLANNFFLMLTKVYDNTADIQISMKIPFTDLGKFSLLLSILSIISALIPSILIARKQTGSILRAV